MLSRNRIYALMGPVLFALGVGSAPASAQDVPLGTAGDFGVLGGTAVTNSGSSIVTGSVGVSPGTSISGFPPGSILAGTGSMHSADAVSLLAQNDLTTAYNDAAGRPGCSVVAGGLLGQGGATSLGPGVYCMDAASLTGTLTLNGPGTYIFQIGSSLTAATGSSVVLTGGASACGVFWQVTSSATIGTTTTMAGNILALASITLNTGANLTGSALARSGAVTLDGNNVTVCGAGGGGLATPAITTQASPAVPIGGLIHDTAFLSSGVAPTGTITFSMFGPDDATCATVPAFTSSVAVAGNGSYDSADFNVLIPGTYRWTAAYSGDSGNAAVSTNCNDANESVVISAAPVATAAPALSAWMMLAMATLLAVVGFAALKIRVRRVCPSKSY